MQKISALILRFTKSSWKYLFTFILFPYTLQVSDSDTLSNELSFGAGGGRYVYQSCHNVHDEGFGDIGVKYSHQTDSHFRYGLAAGATTKGGFLYPDLGLEWPNVAIGTTGIRIGEKKETYFSIGVFNDPPFFSGRGALNLGVGFHPGTPFSHFWIGTNTFPYHELGLVLQPEFQLGNTTFLYFNGRYGTYLNRAEYGLSVGMRIRN